VIALRKARLRLRAAQDGIAMVMVIGVGSVMTLLIISAIALSLGSQNKADNDEDWNGALAAAFAAIEEYQSRLSEEPGYVQYGNPQSEFSRPNVAVPATVKLPPTGQANAAFGVGPTGTWAEGKDTEGNVRFKYRYEVDNRQYSATGTIRVRATGLAGGQTRSLVADVRQSGFIDYLYFTDYEMQDPLISGSSCPSTYTWAGRPASSGGVSCVINFAAGDVIGGSVRSNDSLQICGSTFHGQVVTARPGGGYVKPGGCGNPTFDVGPPLYTPVMSMPATNTELRKETRSDLPDLVPRPGCLYTGPTQITFGPTAGKMTVKSPWTKFTNISGDPAAPTAGNNANSAQCGTIAALSSAAGATVAVLQNNVVFVQNIPLTGINSAITSDTTTSGTSPRCRTTTGTTISATTAGYSQNVVGYPTANEKPLISGTTATASYGCRNGDLFISGTNTGGAITLAAQNYVYVTGDLRYGSNDTDMIGLVGQNAVWVYNPVHYSTGNFLLGNNRRIDAAILSVAHTFQVQNYTLGSSRGTLTVFGSIAQKYRGTVGTGSGSTGYLKNYLYDARFRFTAPPKFLAPASTTYGINVWVEVAPVYRVDGCYRDDPDPVNTGC
jgi:Tfp pilus assembly protein PilX